MKKKKKTIEAHKDHNIQIEYICLWDTVTKERIKACLDLIGKSYHQSKDQTASLGELHQRSRSSVQRHIKPVCDG